MKIPLLYERYIFHQTRCSQSSTGWSSWLFRFQHIAENVLNFALFINQLIHPNCHNPCQVYVIMFGKATWSTYPLLVGRPLDLYAGGHGLKSWRDQQSDNRALWWDHANCLGETRFSSVLHTTSAAKRYITIKSSWRTFTASNRRFPSCRSPVSKRVLVRSLSHGN